MKEVPAEWLELFGWVCDQASHLDPPTCLPIAVKSWFQGTSEEERLAADEALMHWLLTWEWPAMSARVNGMVHLRISFALYGLMQGMAGGREPLRGDAQKRGTIHGLVFRNWHRLQGEWLDYYAANWPSLKTMMNSRGN